MTDMKKKPKTLIVDDSPENIYILMGILKNQYTILAAKNGEDALYTVQTDPTINLILLDIMMPKMDGYTVCRRLKEDHMHKNIPVIFISALSEIDTIVNGFEIGGVDYITKPFHPKEVLVRVNTQIELQQTKTDVQSLLSNTFAGSIKAMIDLLSFSNPALVEKANRIRRYARGIYQKLPIEVEEVWNIDLAVMLSQIGCLALPEIMRKKNSHFLLTNEEQTRYEQYPLLGAEVIARIPRLESVAEIIRYQLYHPSRLKKDLPEIVVLGSSLLNILLTFDDLVENGLTAKQAIAKLKEQVPSYSSTLINGLNEFVENETNIRMLSVDVDKLEPGMTLYKDLVSQTGEVLLIKGTELNESLIQLIKRFPKIGKTVSGKISVTIANH